MEYYLKKSLLPFAYQMVMAMIAFGILMINGLLWLKIILAVLNVGLYVLLISVLAFKEGQDALKVRMANDLERREMIRTGEDRQLKLHEEYKPWKGFFFGFTACIPLLVFMLLHTIVYNATGSKGFGTLAVVLELMFFIFFRLDPSQTSLEAATNYQISWYTYYVALIALPVIMLAMGISYILGAKKIMRQQEMIKERQHKIYGDKV